jgi:hypothetical protein
MSIDFLLSFRFGVSCFGARMVSVFWAALIILMKASVVRSCIFVVRMVGVLSTLDFINASIVLGRYLSLHFGFRPSFPHSPLAFQCIVLLAEIRYPVLSKIGPLVHELCTCVRSDVLRRGRM